MNSLVIGHVHERCLQLNARRLERCGQEPFDHLEDQLLLREGHLQVDLGKLRLPVGP